jgi:hypothetical protein
MNATPSTRRWFQFGLGSALLCVALLAAFLAYHVNWVRQRHEVIDSGTVAAGDGPYHQPGQDPVAPGLLRLFGVGAYGYIIVNVAHPIDQLTPADRARLDAVSRLFPEATIEPQCWVDQDGSTTGP